MAKEFMLLIRNRISHQDEWPAEKHEQFLKSCESYINELKQQGQLIAAQPLLREGVIISGHDAEWNELPFNESAEVQVGYYHIIADDMHEAIAIAKKNPEFAFSKTARIEVRPIKTKEKITGFVYPKEPS
jgi:hypothetical protein